MQLSDTKAYEISPETKQVIQNFIQDGTADGSDENLAAPEANAYEFQAQGIVDMLTKLAGKFEDERTDLEKAETNARQAFEMLSQDLKAQIAQATDARTECSESKASNLQSSAEAKGELADTTQTMNDDTKYLSDLTATCEQKSDAFEERQKLRAEEIAAVEKAIEILSSPDVSGASEKHLPGLVQTKSTSFVQLRAVAQNPSQLKVAAYLKAQG